MLTRSIVVIAPAAQADLAAIWDYIASDQPRNADRFIEQLHQKLRLLASFPDIGRTWFGQREGMRLFPFRQYGVFYLPTGDGIEVVRFLHSTRDLPPHI